MLVSIACIISFNCFVEKPAERVDRRRFHLGISEIKSSVSPKICPPPMLPPPGVRWGNALKFEAKINWIRFGSTLEWSQYRPRPRSPGRSKLDQEKWSSKGGHISEIISSENYWRNPPIKGHRSSIFIQKLFFCPFSISTGDEILSHCTQCPNLLFWIWKYFHSTVQKFENCGQKLADEDSRTISRFNSFLWCQNIDPTVI